MSIILPATRGSFGTNKYYIVTMPAALLIERMKIPKEDKDWKDLDIRSRYQREINYGRVKKQITPYLVENEDRFFGSFVAYFKNSDKIEFETIAEKYSEEIIDKVYKKASENIGYIILEGNEILIPLDGQHRLCALKFAITAKDEKNKDMDHDECPQIGNDMCQVIILDSQNVKDHRRIFNKINRYAKAAAAADKLIIDDDDIHAIIAREHLTGEELIHDRLVKAEKSNTLGTKDRYFTTLSILHTTVLEIIKGYYKKEDTTKLPPIEDQKAYIKTCKQIWTDLLTNFKLFNDCIQDWSEDTDHIRESYRAQYVVCKPIIQLSLVLAYIRLIDNENNPTLSKDEIFRRMNLVDWGFSNSYWENILYQSGAKVITGEGNAKAAAKFIAYALGDNLSNEERANLKNKWETDWHEISKKPFPNPLF